MPTSYSLFAASAPGLEKVTEAEVRRLSASGTKVVPGGVLFSGDLAALYRANLWLRTAQRVLLRVDAFFAVHLAKLHKKLRQIPWEAYIDPETPLEVRATCRKSRIYHSVAAAERAANAIKERLGLAAPPLFGEGAPQSDNDRLCVVLRLDRDHCTVSLDSSGPLLHRRGYRRHSHEAPIRENLAAALLLMCGYDGSVPFWDPMCGTGTLPIEAALIASNTPPGRHRDFAFMRWPGFDSGLWEALLREADDGATPPKETIGGSDIDGAAVWIAAQHARAAGFMDFVRFETEPVSGLTLTAPAGLMVTNPPYGKRIGDRRSVRSVYHELGEAVVRQRGRWHLGVLAVEPGVASATGLDLRPRGDFFPNGGIRVQLFATVD